MILKEHTVKSYDKDLEAIENTIEQMAELLITSIEMIVEAIENPKEELINNIINHDYKINSLDLLIEKKVTAVLALRQPMAVDLRYIVSAIKVSSNLERIGDQAKSIIKKIIKAGNDHFDDFVKKSLLEMIKLTKEMTLASVKAYNNQNIELADNILKMDDQIDQIYSSLFSILDKDSFTTDQVKNVTNILFVAKSFERLADHSTNIAEITKYIVTGEIR